MTEFMHAVSTGSRRHISIMIRHIFLLGSLLIVTLSTLVGQTITGLVVEESEKGKMDPLIGANVYWKSSLKGTTTNENGKFELPFQTSDSTLIISYVGYQSDTIKISQPDKLTVVLKNSRDLNSVEIVHHEKSQELSFMNPLHTIVLDEEELFKAACCNLSESFETNASVDASFTDAISGTKQIQMLGLAGRYSQIMRENIPNVRGLSSLHGLDYIPGDWMKSISITKGTGSVVNGYESITGQINVETRKPNEKEKIHLNLYGNRAGRLEANLFLSQKVSEGWSTSLSLHGKNLSTKNDMNDDGFLDMPLTQSLIGMNRWLYNGVKRVRGQVGIKFVSANHLGGQLNYDHSRPSADQNLWGMELSAQRIEVFTKTALLFPKKKYQSFGLQLTGVVHNQDAYFGLRNYEGDEQSFYANLIYQSIIANTNHTFKTGLSYLYDDFDETWDGQNFFRTERVPGAFFEYTYTFETMFSAIAGVRVDDHNFYGAFVTPRLHLRYAPLEKTVIRGSAGTGRKTANLFADNAGVLASSRQILIQGGRAQYYGLEPEIATNFGVSISQKFDLNYREASVVVDFFRTEFENQVILDVDDSPQRAVFYNLDGQSYANSFQIELNYELLKRLDMRLAYRFYDVKATYLNRGLRSMPFVANNRGFLNLAYKTKISKKQKQWKFDATGQIVGQQRLPDSESNPQEYQWEQYSPQYFLLSGQVTHVVNERFNVYLGGENLTNYQQDKPIISAEDPFSPYFDSSVIWAPIFGINIYGGLRYTIF